MAVAPQLSSVDLGLRGKRAIVTGGSRGIGRSIVLALAHQGVSVAACYNRESDAVAQLRGELESIGNGSYAVQADVADPDSVQSLVDGAREALGEVEILVNNAGVVSHKTLEDLELDEWRRIIDTNLTGIYLVTRGILGAIPAGGSIINITSAVGLRGMVGRTHYTSSKTGVIGFTRSLAKEVGPRGIRVNAIAPGIIETDQTSGLNDEGRARYEKLTALARLGDPDEIAGATLFFASDLSSYVSGVTMNVDGGI
jgi:NAD(P)-dependent dehydrogenase (short-subunit alcohol dehydrogenase family)